MAAKDTYHDLVRLALEKENWIITDDPLRIKIGHRKLKIDLGAERVLGAEKEGKKIAVEIKSFLGVSQLHDFYLSLGQFNVYRIALAEVEPNRQLFLAIPLPVYEDFFQEPLTLNVIQAFDVNLLVYDLETASIKLWKI